MHGCTNNKIPEKKAERIFNLMEEFAGYGFNKSHSCAYALLAYQTAYMKTHYPVEFIAALLTSETGNAEKAVKYINEARGMGISILPPDVNESDLYFTPIGEAIRFGLAAIKNVGENTAKAIRDSRLATGEFKALYDFCERIEPRFLNKRVFESLIKSGAVDSLGPREAMAASIDDALASLHCAMRRCGAKKSAWPASTRCWDFMFPAIRWKNTPRDSRSGVYCDLKKWKGSAMAKRSRSRH